MIKKYLKNYYIAFFILSLIFSTTACGNRLKETSGELKSPAETAVPTDAPKTTSDTADALNPAVDKIKNFKPEALTLGENRWEMLADVSKITGQIRFDSLLLCGLIAKDSHNFSVHMYEDCGDADYIDSYHVR